MAAKRNISGKKPQFGNRRSFSMRATRRKFNPNRQSKRIFIPELNQVVRVQVSVDELKTIDKIGISEFLKRRGISAKSLL
jgi:large subunit ribosomal protein L28